jgi:hypothetical protein
VLALLLTHAISAASSAPASWPLYTAPDTAFSARFPTHPVVVNNPQVTTYSVTLPDAVYSVAVGTLAPPLSGMAPENALKAFQDSIVRVSSKVAVVLVTESERSVFGTRPSLAFTMLLTSPNRPRFTNVSLLIHTETAIVGVSYTAPTENFDMAHAKSFIATLQIPGQKELTPNTSLQRTHRQSLALLPLRR